MLQLRTYVEHQSALDHATVLLFALHFQWRSLARFEKVEAESVRRLVLAANPRGLRISVGAGTTKAAAFVSLEMSVVTITT